jgi:tripartite ATP-independent transporter DctP family solute receptor
MVTQFYHSAHQTLNERDMFSKSGSLFIVGFLLGLLGATVLFSLLTRGGKEAAEARQVFKLAHSLPPSAPVHLGMVRFAELVKEKSGGTVEVQIFPSGQLGSETEAIEQLQRGALAIVKTSAAAMEGFVPEMAVFGVPYLFRDAEHFWDVLESPIGEELLVGATQRGIRGLCYYASGARSFYTAERPILAPSDLAGIKIRTMRSATAIAMIETMGGAAAAIPFGELYTALQQGMVDGAENNPPSLYDSRHWEVARHYSLDEHTRIPDVLIFSERIWGGLSEEVQGWLVEAALESVPYQRQIWDEYVASCLDNLRAEGVSIYYPDKAPFQKAVQPMVDGFMGTTVGDLMERIARLERSE